MVRVLLGCILGMMSVLAGGCDTYHPRNLSAASSDRAFRERGLNDPGLRNFVMAHAPAVAHDWPPLQFNLNALSLVAMYYQPDLETARAKLAGAEAAVVTAGERPNPVFGFTPNYSEPPYEFFSPWTLGFTLDVPIETAGKRGHRIAEARFVANSARLGLANAAWLARSRVRAALLDLYAASLKLPLLSRQQAVQNQMVAVLEDRLKAGESARFEVQLVRVAASQTTLLVRDAEAQAHQARARLADALGMRIGAIEAVRLSFTDFDPLPAPADAGKFQREALLNRPDILGALCDYEAAQCGLQLEIARQYPDIHLGPGYQWNQGVNNYTLGVSLTLPVFDQNQGPILEARARRRQAAAAFLALQARAIGAVDAALIGYRDALAKLQTADALLRDEQQRVATAQEALDAGAADRLDLLQAQLAEADGELARAGAFIEAQQALGLLEDAMQRTVEHVAASPSPATRAATQSSQRP